MIRKLRRDLVRLDYLSDQVDHEDQAEKLIISMILDLAGLLTKIRNGDA